MRPKVKPASTANTKTIPRKGFLDLVMKYRLLLLILIPAAVYFNVMTLQYIAIDDTMFVGSSKVFNQDWSNLVTSFQRGLFQAADKSLYDYYRPLFLVDMIIEYHLFGDNATGYHLTNLLFHILSVILLYFFLRKLGIGDTSALILSLLFAVHPAISHAVAWIPGRNDMILMIFLLSGMIFTIRYGKSGTPQDFVFQALFFLLAVFTKETAIIIPVLAFFILFFVTKASRRSLYLLCAGWISTVLFWFFMESTVKQSGNRFPVSDMVESGLSRFQAFPQYLGKIFFPFNLSVHPQIDEISLVWGILAVGAVIALLIYSKSYFKPLTILGIAWFLLFLMPVLAVPKIFNDLVYEHRLYIPMAGILVVLSQTFLFDGTLKGLPRFFIFGGIITIMGITSFIRVDYFKDPLAYWSRAVVESPRNAYSIEMKATWIRDEKEQEKLFRQAYALDPNLRDINLYLGKVAFNNRNYDEAEKFLKRELVITPVKLPDNYFLLGQIAFQRKNYGEMKGYMRAGLAISPQGNAEAYSLIAQACFFENNLDSAEMNLLKVLELEPGNGQAGNNLLMVYIKLGQKEKAAQLVRQMRQNGLEVPPKLLNMLGIQ